jgi:predicted Rossmann fold nucleotide-binding protein DprA/Smf involved in DNA uptake
MILGFTGTRKGMTDQQRTTLARHLAALGPHIYLHGGAPGADEESHEVALEQVLPCCMRIEVYPCNERQASFFQNAKPKVFLAGKDMVVYPIRKPLDRNRLIASRCDRLIATPAGKEEQRRSGTWATIRYAIQAGKPVTIIQPDGSTYTRDPTPRPAVGSGPATVGDQIVAQFGVLPLGAHFKK